MENDNGLEPELNWNNLPAIAKRALKIVATEQGFVTYKIDIESGSKLGDGYMSVIVRATIIGTKALKDAIEIKDASHEFTVLCKIQVLSKARREFTNSNEAFKREISLYNDYLPELEKLQLEHGISVTEGFFNYPKCYYAEYDIETDDAIIVMKDMRDEGYKLANKYKPLDIGICEIVVQGLGKLHALSFALEKKRPELFVNFKKYGDIMAKIMTQPQTQQMWDSIFPAAINSLRGEHPKIEEKIHKLRENLSEEFLFLVDDKNSGKFSVVGHGDSWTNNFLFKFGLKNQPEDIIFIDWQVSRYASPVLDLVYFLFTATDKDTRDHHFANLLKLYHDSFSTLLRKFGENPDKIYSFDVFQQEMKKFARFGLLMSICLLCFVTISPDDLPDMDEAMEDLMKEDQESGGKNVMMAAAEANSKLMEPRIRDIILDFEHFGYF